MLGIILAPYGQIPGAYPSGINYSWGGNGQYLCPEDAQYQQNGEAGYYTDTPLGGTTIPTDFDQAKVLGYMPVTSGWTTFANNYWPGSWVPPDGYRMTGSFSPAPIPRHLNGLGDDPSAVPVQTADDVVAVMNAQNQRIFTLSLVSTLAVAVSALFTLYRTQRLLKEDRRRAG